MNEDTDDREALRRKVRRLQEELAVARQQAGQGQPQFIVRRLCCCFVPVRPRARQVHPSSPSRAADGGSDRACQALGR